MTPLEFEIVRLSAKVECDLANLCRLQASGYLEDDDLKAPMATAAELSAKLKLFMTFGQTVDEAGLGASTDA